MNFDHKTVALAITCLSPLIPIILGRKQYRNVLWKYVAMVLLFELTTITLKRVLHVNYFWAANLFFVTEFLFIASFYKDLVPHKRLYRLLILAALLFFLVTSIIFSKVNDVNGYGVCLFYLVYIAFSVRGFFVLMIEMRYERLSDAPLFWANIAFLFYAAGNFFLFLYKDYMRETNAALFVMLWRSLFLTLNIFRSVFLAVALRKMSQDGPQ